MGKILRIKKLTAELNRLTELYDKGIPEISDKEWDDMYFELVALEDECGHIEPNSPTQKVNYTVANELQKVKHNHPMLSLDKTKDIEEIKTFIDDKDWIAMLKMDGLTCSLLYEGGQLVRAETRGDGNIGEDITHNAIVIPSIPKRISYTDRLVVDGEIICKLDDFEDFSSEYKNARNFASGSIRLLDSNECAKRKLTFVAWDIISGYEKECNTLNRKLEKLIYLDFEVVPFTILGTIEESIEWLRNHTNNYPIDGLVFKINKCAEYEAMGRTDHHFRGGLAFKFYNELYKTKLTDIEWTIGKTGTLTPTAIFETVEIDGCDISRASLHNISIIKKLGLMNNCTVKISKRNEIIPQVEECLQDGDSDVEIPKYCPFCGVATDIVKENESEVLMCTNPYCSGKLLGKFKFFVSKPAINIEGLSEKTLETLINMGWLVDFKDIYTLYKSRDWWITLSGFGEKSVDNILEAIEKSRNTTLDRFICALSIDGIGKSAAKTVSDYFSGDFYAFIEAFDDGFNWAILDDIGEKTSQNINEYLVKNKAEICELAEEFEFIMPQKVEIKDNPLIGIKFCITGSFSQSRDNLKKQLEIKGAKFVSSVSKNLDILFCGEKAGSKLTKAQQLGIKIADEKELMRMLEG